METKSKSPTNLHYDSEKEDGGIPLPPGMDAQWFAREGINVLLNGGVSHAEKLFRKFRHCSPLLSAGASLVDFITAAMTFEDEKMENALESLKSTIKMCQVDSLFEGIITKRPSEKWTTVERIERMVIWADCELFLAFLMFLKQRVVDFVKAGYHMRRAWKMYEKCHIEIHGFDPKANDKFKNSPSKKNKKSRTPTPPNANLSAEDILFLNASLSFGYGLIQVALSIVPSTLLKVCEIFGFTADREKGLNALQTSSSSADMKAPIARLTLLWYHTVVRPFCALDGNNMESGLQEASHLLQESEKEFPTSAIFLYFKALVFRLRYRLVYMWRSTGKKGSSKDVNVEIQGQLDDALSVLDTTLESSKEQREIALLCYYDKGWCHLMKLEWQPAVDCFSQLKSQSRWSEAYYTYLLSVTLGALGNSFEASTYLKAVPKLVVRKTQLEIFLARKSNLFKKTGPTKEEYTLLSLELLYLWNAFPQCSQKALNKMIQEVEKCDTPRFQPLKLLILGAIYHVLNDIPTATQYLTIAASKSDSKSIDAHVIPYAIYELATIQMTHEQEKGTSQDVDVKNQNNEKARDFYNKIRESYSGYDFENRLNFRIHAALNNIDDLEEIKIAQQKLAPPQVDGL